MEGVITTVAKNPLEEIRISRRTYKTFRFYIIHLKIIIYPTSKKLYIIG